MVGMLLDFLGCHVTEESTDCVHNHSLQHQRSTVYFVDDSLEVINQGGNDLISEVVEFGFAKALGYDRRYDCHGFETIQHRDVDA